MYIEVYSGLTSRIQTLIEAYSIAREHGDELKVVWPKEYHCYIDFWDVFDKNSFKEVPIQVIQIDYGKNLDQRIRRNLKDRHLLKAFCALRIKIQNKLSKYQPKEIYVKLLRRRSLYFDTTPPPRVGWPKGKSEGWSEYLKWDHDIRTQINDAVERREREIYIRAYCGFRLVPETNYSIISFKNEYSSIVNEIFKNHFNIVGIHMRRNDHKISISINPTDEFYHMMDLMIQENPDIAFFLATDSLEEEKKVVDKYGRRILLQKNKVWGFGSTKGMKSSIIDLLALSRCQLIIGSEGSVFSKFAAEYGGVKLIYSHRNTLLQNVL